MNRIVNYSLKLILIFLFIASAILKYQGLIFFDFYDFFVLAVLITVFFFEKKLTWIIGLFLFLFGIANVLIVGLDAAEPTAFQIGVSVLQLLLKGNTNSIVEYLTFWFPLYFYVLAIFYFLMKKTRLNYDFG